MSDKKVTVAEVAKAFDMDVSIVEGAALTPPELQKAFRDAQPSLWARPAAFAGGAVVFGGLLADLFAQSSNIRYVAAGGAVLMALGLIRMANSKHNIQCAAVAIAQKASDNALKKHMETLDKGNHCG